MIARAKKLGGALWVETIRRLPYIGFVLVVLILFQVFKTGQQVAENVRISKRNSEANSVVLDRIAEISEANKSLSEDNKELSEQSRNLSEQNVALSQVSNSYQNCIAQLFAKYTRDGLPIVIQDLETCSASFLAGRDSLEPVPVSPQPTASSPTTQPSPLSQQQSGAKPKKCKFRLGRFCI